MDEKDLALMVIKCCLGVILLTIVWRTVLGWSWWTFCVASVPFGYALGAEDRWLERLRSRRSRRHT